MTPRETPAEKFRREYHSNARVNFIARLPCCACGRRPTPDYPTENAHVRNGGTGRKADYWWIVPLCMWCHRHGWHGIGGGRVTLLLRAGGVLRLVYQPPGEAAMWIRKFKTWDECAEATENLWLTRGIAA